MKSGTEIDLVNRNVANVEALRGRGATIQSAADFSTPINHYYGFRSGIGSGGDTS
jgi:hypothetical protein